MRTRKVWKLLTAALLGLGVPAVANATDPDGSLPRPGSTSIFSQWLHGGTSNKPAPTKTPAKRPPPRPTEDPTAKARAQEMANWLRRTEVCLRLMQVADETNDDTLRKKAQELDRRSRTAYEHRMAELDGGSGATDEDLLERRRDDGQDSNDRSAGLVPRSRIKNDHADRTETEEGSE